MSDPRFTMKEEEPREEGAEDLKTNRIRALISEKKGFWPIAKISAIALAGIAIIAIVTTFIYKSPSIFSPSSNESASKEGIYSDNEKKQLPDEKLTNPHLIKGKESYFKGYLNDALTEFNEVVDSDASDKEKAIALTYIGIIHDDRGKYDEAIEFYNRALKYNRKNPIIYRNLSLAYRHKKQYKKADETIGKAIEIEPKNVKNRMLYGNILFEQEKYKDAREQYGQALEVEPENASILYNLALTLLRLGDEVPAIEYLKKAGAADSMGNIGHRAFSKLGVLYSRQKAFDEAEKYLKRAIAINPKDAIDRYNLGLLYLKQKRNEEAFLEFKKAEELGAEDVTMLENLGEAYASLKEYDRSLDSYNRILKINKRNIRILSRVAELYYEKGDLEQAYEFYKRIPLLEPVTESARIAYLNMGNILDDAQRYDEAIEHYKKALAISPKNDAVYYNLGIAYTHAGKPELAIEAWKKASSLNPNNPKPRIAVANHYYEKKHFDYAMDEYLDILRRWPDIQEGHLNLATIYFKKNQTEYAIGAYKRVIEINGKNEFARKAYINLGVLTARKKDGLDEGMSFVRKALLLHPGDAEALMSLGSILYRKKMFDKAIDTYFQALKGVREGKLLAEAYGNIGKCYYKKEMYKKSLQYFTRAIEEDPTNEELRMNRKVAMQSYEQAIDVR